MDGAKVDAPLIKESNLLQFTLRFRQDQAPGYRAREIENEPNILTIIVLAFGFGLLGLCALAPLIGGISAIATAVLVFLLLGLSERAPTWLWG